MKGLQTCLLLLHHRARCKPDMKGNYLWARGMSTIKEQTGRPVLGRLLIKLLRVECWQELVFFKSGNLMNWWKVRIGRLVNEQPPGLFTQHTDRFIVDDDDMDSDTVAESDTSLKSRSFLNRVNDRVRKMQNQSSKDATQDSNKHSWTWWMFMSSTLEASVFMGKNCLENLHSIQKYRKRSHNETDVRHIWKIDSRTIRGDLWSEYN